jgi:hypothetical protein
MAAVNVDVVFLYRGACESTRLYCHFVSMLSTLELVHELMSFSGPSPLSVRHLQQCWRN